MNSVIKIGDKYYTEAYGDVIVIDIFISPTTKEEIYRVKEDRGNDTTKVTYLATADELDDYENDNRHQ